jgi:hypothetical protein
MEGLRVVLAGAGRTLVTLVMVLGAPAALGALRAMLSGAACYVRESCNTFSSRVPTTFRGAMDSKVWAWHMDSSF